MRGFILQPTYRVVGSTPEVHLYGTLESGESFLVVDDRVRPYFFVPASHADAATGPEVRLEPTDLVALDGTPVARVTVDLPAHVPPLRERLQAKGIPCYEADLRFVYSYLRDRDLRGAISIDGPWRPQGRIRRVYRNPTLAPADYTPRLRTLSLDIETDLTASSLFAIGLAGLGTDRALIVGPGSLRNAECFPDERTLLLRFLALLNEVDPDVLTGWNVVDFDLSVLQRLCKQHGIPFRLGRTDDEIVIQRDQGFTREARAAVPGRMVLDGLALVRSAFIRLDDYKLETAARAFLGKGKLMTGDGSGREIVEAFRHDRQKLVDYNLRDAELALEIVERQHLIDLAVSRSRLTGMQLDRVGASIASIDFLYLTELHRRGHVAPSVTNHPNAAVAGGAVLDSVPGLFTNILVFDFKSLYPSIIRTFNIDPLTYLAPDAAGHHAEPIRTPSGACFRREPGILPELVARLWVERDAARAAGDLHRAHAIKILMNSLYGVLAATTCRFFSPAIANAITLAGQHLIHIAAAEVRRFGHRVIYGDTDSLFVDVGEPDPERAETRAHELRLAIGTMLAAHLRERFGVESHLDLEYEKCYRRFFMPEVRQGTGGSKKRYAGIVGDGPATRLEIVGLEAVRRDWTPLAKRFQRELLDRVFRDRPVDDFVREFLASLHQGALDDHLTYKKAVRKRLADYTKTTPAHVKAARKQRGPRTRIVEYVVTAAGPEPVDERRSALDYEHYVTKQLAPIADALLRFVGVHFADLAGRPRQLELW
ncbi:MAG: DNA polymerase II [Deltaproteobacteria bacterium]|nr:DNA polymerase II [Deltaproteobacteria bacterium]